jgi:nitrogen fixation/metabolism regulation signal transduction histidine kinase
LGRVLDSLNIGVVFVDCLNTIQVFNTAAGVMLGQDPVSRIGSSVLVCHAEESAPVVLQRISDLSSGRVSTSQNWLNYRGRMLREYILPVRDPNGEAAGTLLLLHDAAEHVDALKRLGVWTEVHVSGLGERAPRAAGPASAVAQTGHSAEKEPAVGPESADNARHTAGDCPGASGNR